jgi:hypothetical protein
VVWPRAAISETQKTAVILAETRLLNSARLDDNDSSGMTLIDQTSQMINVDQRILTLLSK